MSVNTPRLDGPPSWLDDQQLAAVRLHNSDSGGYLKLLMEAAYGPRGRNLWDRANIERLINDAEDYMEEQSPDPWTTPDFEAEWYLYRRWSDHVRDTIYVLRRLLTNDPATIAQHGLIDDLVVDSEDVNDDIATHMAQTSLYPKQANPFMITARESYTTDTCTLQFY